MTPALQNDCNYSVKLEKVNQTDLAYKLSYKYPVEVDSILCEFAIKYIDSFPMQTEITENEIIFNQEIIVNYDTCILEGFPYAEKKNLFLKQIDRFIKAMERYDDINSNLPINDALLMCIFNKRWNCN
ncbi:MAG: hypothetical protein P4L35_07915 [Ignavibacteriaceae bacterium]|nr:hypothetical protein [Ignavibacteriaceae bacterium]